ncbi:hypothetical protein NliqN6_3544 [Naganishia liquefaciens]|uniref:Uncharacterized protein n=1 Tax=Naganishia liquefaciens TaxID=104408 RepID=A0A8H3TTZ8_9TREE|nr:hypothetical protein NliqN6_3544 [Naganishia liquefaciens]
MLWLAGRQLSTKITHNLWLLRTHPLISSDHRDVSRQRQFLTLHQYCLKKSLGLSFILVDNLKLHCCVSASLRPL